MSGVDNLSNRRVFGGLGAKEGSDRFKEGEGLDRGELRNYSVIEF